MESCLGSCRNSEKGPPDSTGGFPEKGTHSLNGEDWARKAEERRKWEVSQAERRTLSGESGMQMARISEKPDTEVPGGLLMGLDSV